MAKLNIPEKVKLKNKYQKNIRTRTIHKTKIIASLAKKKKIIPNSSTPFEPITLSNKIDYDNSEFSNISL